MELFCKFKSVLSCPNFPGALIHCQESKLLTSLHSKTLYGRLVLLKMSAVTIAAPPAQTPITAQFVPSLSLAATFSTASAQLTTPPGHYYQRALGLCERLFEGAVDQATFEDTLRRMFGTQAYIMFTIDKLCNSVVKLVSAKYSPVFPVLIRKNTPVGASCDQRRTLARTAESHEPGSGPSRSINGTTTELLPHSSGECHRQ